MTRGTASAAVLTLLLGSVGSPQPVSAQHSEEPRTLEALDIDMPAFGAYEVEYTSQSGRFLHQVRTYESEGDSKINILNIIQMPNGVIVDSRGIDASTLALEYVMSPYFAWGQEYMVAQFRGTDFDLVRIPLGGGEPQRSTGSSDRGPVVGDLGFSPVFASVLPLPDGTRFALPQAQPTQAGTFAPTLVTFEVTGTERLELDSGLSCDCWVLEQTGANGSVTKFWVAREAPFVFRRHRDVGGPRDFVSDALSFRSLR